MNSSALIISALLALLVPQSFGHGWSEEMRHELNAPAPDWLVVGPSIKVDETKQSPTEESVYRPISGDSQSTRDRVTIPSRGIEIKVDYPISWYRGSSLSPDGTKLIINSGTESKVYEILSDGQHRQIELKLPHVTYDAGPKGFISGWSWADNNTLIGEAEIDNEKGEFIEKRIYVFYANEKVLSRLDVSDLGWTTTEGLTVTEVAADLSGLRLSLDDTDFAVKVDLKLPAQLAEQRPNGSSVTLLENHSVAPKPLQSTREQQSQSAASPIPTLEVKSAPLGFSVLLVTIIMLIVVIAGIIIYVLRRKST